MLARFYKERFVIENWFGPFEGWATKDRWNGWACPCFEFDTAMQMVEAWNDLAFGEEYEARYDDERDTFWFRDGGLEEWASFRAQTIEVESKTIKVYPIGAYCWTWSNEDE